jgi:hypothetical protein
MKSILRVLLCVAALSSAVVLVGTPENQPRRVDLKLVLYAECKNGHPEWVIMMGGLAYRSVEELKKGVERLPRGSEIVWDPGCDISGGEPLRSKEEFADFKKHCESLGIILRVIPSG